MTKKPYSNAHIRGAVVWPDPSPLSQWWAQVMGLPTRGDESGENTEATPGPALAA
ncbi:MULTISPECIES: hypothetical protein [Nocardia]|uniref:hypothetical protein n=1 Tax=Nocardia TaxID=1817 RepID=UPI001300915B|nr:MULTISPECIES: hypothetical protein [Nocardia]